ncbi:MerR family transcriptional regulator [Actinoplanes derwentensis]|uniref:Effector-binding domain-containing protein n=1 Tax=Actinoplanes derwentensis TaxID=113562 RepID=A0A1H1TTF5_9ACTN|nr:MerR family transcriptional regulator [Actinoplanes derwentensis]GID85132.1 MerR family transcriptional regulator [Actinoplanes derwentensis]SDS63553.1 effector-binding domain-containing protein [Actinoplanes derwentensis]
MPDDLIPIGRFSRMSRLSIKALRFYDEQGLLTPARVDPASGYRFYRRGQAGRAEAIRVLRLIDMPVTEIRDLLADDDPELTGKRLSAHRERLRDRLAEQERMLRFLERLIDRGGNVMPYQVTVKEVAANPVAGLRLTASLATIGAVLQQGFGTVAGALGAAGVAPAGPPFVVYHDVIDERTEGEVEICLPVPAGTPVPSGPVYYREVPGGPVASTIHRGPYQEISPAYHVVTGWIEEHGIVAHGAPREIYLNDPQSAGSPEELITELQFPIDRVPPA